MENIYQKWDGINLSTEFEDRMIHLCVKVLSYIDVAIKALNVQSQGGGEMGRDGKELRLVYGGVLEADRRCRSFSVVIETGKGEEKMDGDGEKQKSPMVSDGDVGGTTEAEIYGLDTRREKDGNGL